MPKLSELSRDELVKKIDALYILLDEEDTDGFILHSKILILQNQLLIMSLDELI
jgi:hypothetical protein